MDKVIISAAITGAVHTPSMSPYLPISPKQLADEAVAACEAGAAIVHIHVLKHPLIFLQDGEYSLVQPCVRPAVRRIRRATVAIVALASWEYVHKACALGEIMNGCDVSPY